MNKNKSFPLFQKIINGSEKKDINNGFTLLEILVAIVIFAIIVAILYPAFTDTYNNIEAAQTESDIYYMARIAMARIVDDLQSAYIPDASGDTKNVNDKLTVSNAFVGQDEYLDDVRADEIRFHSRSHINFGDSAENQEDAKIAYYAIKNQDTGSITLYRSDTMESRDWPEEKTGGFIICEDLYSFYLTYTDKNGENYDSWDSSDINFRNQLPSMVTITLEFINKNDPETPIIFTTGVTLPMAENK